MRYCWQSWKSQNLLLQSCVGRIKPISRGPMLPSCSKDAEHWEVLLCSKARRDPGQTEKETRNTGKRLWRWTWHPGKTTTKHTHHLSGFPSPHPPTSPGPVLSVEFAFSGFFRAFRILLWTERKGRREGGRKMETLPVYVCEHKSWWQHPLSQSITGTGFLHVEWDVRTILKRKMCFHK